MHFNDCDMDLSRNDKITRKPHKPRGRVGGIFREHSKARCWAVCAEIPKKCSSKPFCLRQSITHLRPK